MSENSEDLVMSEERKAFILVIPAFQKLFLDTRKSVVTLTICCKCLCCLVSKKCDEVFRKKLLFESDIVKVIKNYLDMYDYEEKFVLCCLDLFSYMISEQELNIVEYLYGSTSLFNRLKKFFEPTGVPGTYYSQRV
jgi:hypothetical protein